jgi:hypothetical protein
MGTICPLAIFLKNNNMFNEELTDFHQNYVKALLLDGQITTLLHSPLNYYLLYILILVLILLKNNNHTPKNTRKTVTGSVNKFV